MEKSDHENEKKRVTKAVTDEPQEEFIEPRARPSKEENKTSGESAS